MNFEIKQEGEFKYVERGSGPVIIYLHGLFGALSNFKDCFDPYTDEYTVVLPILPLYEAPVQECTVSGMVEYIKRFVDFKGYKDVTLLGNSLGGHVGLLFTLNHSDLVKALVLTGSSGLFENSLGDTFPKRGDYDYIKAKTEDTFYDPAIATKELVDEIFEIVQNRDKIVRVISMAKSAIRHNLADKLSTIDQPTLLIWGADDTVTPAFVGVEFKNRLKNSELHFINKCGHAAMMERPDEFNVIFKEFLDKIGK